MSANAMDTTKPKLPTRKQMEEVERLLDQMEVNLERIKELNDRLDVNVAKRTKKLSDRLDAISRGVK